MGERLSQHERALRELRAMILQGRFEANARLSEPALAEELGISRTPLRQAMARLVEEGLLERLDTGRCRVASFTIEDIFDAIELRGVVEGTAARLAAERGISAAHAREGQEILASLDRAVSAPGGLDFETYVRLNARFHRLIAEMPGSAIIAREVERATRLPLASPSAFLQGQETVPDFAASLRHAQTQHRAIFEAITGREGTRAEALMREHARLARQNLRHVLKAGPSVAGKVPGLALISN
ncbi:GntR family transcriptional regulator, vanillate catabolism transcriptional regulator [Meinhardsimonia xiamenensis]|jgi:GntR family transcriptional regulator of vanillate catabolism|uniref:GntR family transcriptional regulator, vanillate catabolism transcriptional regulator n=1 Tax=Meinhardsimonia xiamenensis TaxID=990712 RepID=A0A1G9AY48_9RHOB|nr:GntR family transcriptional regulator [Meinhardsimonia xiamenensis]PRX35204.1 GntR family transcriptional regulator of vanillate catabolism [Meinhardsimonia xiamenensis]SDK32167.1 GntR family transcriptional regulator, vanillate catabolism transcriptional regulator [Meinhardsimonia xiamenensis]